MNIVLLCGGSGKRLWPLSNDIRSKQFIPFFRDDDGAHVSMMQRVYSQILQAAPDSRVLVATGEAQVDSVRSQLGADVSVCVEPARRDTFPAIALAAAYMHDQMGVADEAAVVVCPVDPDVDATFFEAIRRLEALVEQGGAALTLMGIEPASPSEKFGYILPENLDAVSPVRAFREKPPRLEAEALIAQGALWNAGVFGCTLGYLRSRTREILGRCDYTALLENYANLRRISFDYAVVEHEKSIRVLRYRGEWRDVGSWNALCDTLREPVNGNGVLGPGCEDTLIVNELDIPILCVGCRDMIVAAGSDGILVADRVGSDGIKPFVEAFGDDVFYAEKAWGCYRVLDKKPGLEIVKIHLNAGCAYACQCPEGQQRTLSALSGAGEAGGAEMQPGDTLRAEAGESLRVTARTEMILLESRIGGAQDGGWA